MEGKLAIKILLDPRLKAPILFSNTVGKELLLVLYKCVHGEPFLVRVVILHSPITGEGGLLPNLVRAAGGGDLSQ